MSDEQLKQIVLIARSSGNLVVEICENGERMAIVLGTPKYIDSIQLQYSQTMRALE